MSSPRTYTVEYTANYGKTTEQMAVSAVSYTEAYTQASMKLPIGVMITKIFEVKEA